MQRLRCTDFSVRAYSSLYLKLTGLKRGLLLNFKVERLIDGIKRVSL